MLYVCGSLVEARYTSRPGVRVASLRVGSSCSLCPNRSSACGRRESSALESNLLLPDVSYQNPRSERPYARTVALGRRRRYFVSSAIDNPPVPSQRRRPRARPSPQPPPRAWNLFISPRPSAPPIPRGPLASDPPRSSNPVGAPSAVRAGRGTLDASMSAPALPVQPPPAPGVTQRRRGRGGRRDPARARPHAVERRGGPRSPG